MQTLGLSDSTPRTESRLKSLFWPSIQTRADADYLGVQGYWVCFLVATLTFVFLLLGGQFISGFFIFLYFYMGGVGIRSGSRYAATFVVAYYILDWLSAILVRPMALLSPSIIMRICFTGLLISNLRATWLAATWTPGAEGTLPERAAPVSWGDRFADQFPLWLWPKVRVLYYVYSVCVMLLTGIGLVIIVRRSM